MKKIQIQSASDLITNSSSEVFIKISSDDKALITRVYEWIDKCLGFTEKMDSDLYFTCRMEEPGFMDNDMFDVLVRCPQYMYEQADFFREGVDAILRKDFKDDYTKLTIDKSPW